MTAARRASVVVILLLVVVLGLLLLERTGPSPARPLVRISTTHQVTPTGTDRPADDDEGPNPNRHCKPHGFPGCRPPSGNESGD
jgi:hypothetical protein